VLLLLILATLPGFLAAQPQTDAGPSQLLLVVNRDDPPSAEIGEYYRVKRVIPQRNICRINASSDEQIGWSFYEEHVENPIARCLRESGLQETVLYIVLAMDAPLKVGGGGSGLATEKASVDSELAWLYAKLHGRTIPRAGGLANPFFGRRDEPFRHPSFPIYLVTRLAAYDLPAAKAMVDRSLAAHNRGKFVIDISPGSDSQGNAWLRNAAVLLPPARVVLDDSPAVLYGQRDVIGYAAWGSNDGARHGRFLNFQWLPGAIATEFVSTNARTLKPAPAAWNLTTWEDRWHWFGGSPQSLTTDYIREGAAAATGNVFEPFLIGCARPDYLLPAYFEGRNLAESYYLSIPFLSWQGVLLGDPLSSLGRP